MKLIRWDVMKNPVNWLTVGVIALFFAMGLRECLRLFEGGEDKPDTSTSAN